MGKISQYTQVTTAGPNDLFLIDTYPIGPTSTHTITRSNLINSLSGAVSSVFGRTGAIVAQSGDYTAAQVGALASTSDLSSIASTNATAGHVSLNSHKITNLADGTVSSDAATFGQIPTSLPPNGSAGGVLGGTYPNPSFASSTGSGAVVLATSPMLVTPNLGDATATSINLLTITGPVSNATLSISDGKTFSSLNSITLAGVDGKTLTMNNSLTLAGTDATTMTFPSTSDSIVGRTVAQAVVNKTLSDTIMGNTFITQSATVRNIVLLAATAALTIRKLEIGLSYSFEIPADSSMEIWG